MPLIMSDFKPLLLVARLRLCRMKGCAGLEADMNFCMAENHFYSGAQHPYSLMRQWVAEQSGRGGMNFSSSQLYFGTKPVINKDTCSWVLQAKCVRTGRRGRIILSRRAKILATGERSEWGGTGKGGTLRQTSFYKMEPIGI